MFGGLRTTTDRPRYLRCVERPGIVGVTGNLSGALVGVLAPVFPRPTITAITAEPPAHA